MAAMSANAVVRIFLGRCLFALLLALLPSVTVVARDDAPLQFQVTEGRVLNAFHRRGDVAAHLLLSSGSKPRVLVAFPAGNSGAGVWFEDTDAPVQWASALSLVLGGALMRWG